MNNKNLSHTALIITQLFNLVLTILINENNLETDAYTITGRHGREREEIQLLLDKSTIYYINEDKNKTISWLSALGLQLPSATIGFGLIKRLPQSLIGVNKNKANETKDSTGKILSEGQIAHFAESKALSKTGKLLHLYHGTFADFTQFDMSKADENAYYGPGIYLTTYLKMNMISGDTTIQLRAKLLTPILPRSFHRS